MNHEKAVWTRRYHAALRRHLESGASPDLCPALKLGRRAVNLGMEILDVAGIHKQALMTLVTPGNSSRPRQRLVDRANNFFAETIVPIEKTHRAAVADDIRVSRLADALRLRAAETAASTRQVTRSIVGRIRAEARLVKSREHRARVLAKSRRLQRSLRRLTRACLSAQELGRKSVSRELQDEIAQTLVAMTVRLLALKEASRKNTENVKKEIAETQGLVKQCTKMIIRLNHECGIQREKRVERIGQTIPKGVASLR